MYQCPILAEFWPLGCLVTSGFNVCIINQAQLIQVLKYHHCATRAHLSVFKNEQETTPATWPGYQAVLIISFHCDSAIPNIHDIHQPARCGSLSSVMEMKNFQLLIIAEGTWLYEPKDMRRCHPHLFSEMYKPPVNNSPGCYLDEWPVLTLSQVEACTRTSDCYVIPVKGKDPNLHLY